MERVHARFDECVAEAWSASLKPAPAGATCQTMYELTPKGYDRLFEALLDVAGKGPHALYEFGFGCGRALALAVASGAFAAARGCEVVPERAQAAARAVADLGLQAAVQLQTGSFCKDDVLETCVLCADSTFDRATTMCAADMLNASPAWLALASFKPPSHWKLAGLKEAELQASGTAFTTGQPPERVTYYVYGRLPRASSV